MMNLALILSQFVSCGCSYRIFKHNAECCSYSLKSNREYKAKSLTELISIIPEKVEIAKEFQDTIVYDIFIL